ncbi:MAG: ferredoxin [Nocardia sp.]|uniref:ferredoxin n=1 Tax=Nocardia sp. TaxID=1821 RepID=UPI00262BAD26|nr:ferredoxin [Nocardia sp.]MCU1644358.1 ferredoxin [Nocardia sp.]
MRVSVNSDLCMGHTLCNAIGPDVYQLDEQGHCCPMSGDIPADLEAQAVEGADACPERALTIHSAI